MRRRKHAVTIYPKIESGDLELDLEEILYLNSLKDRTQGLTIVDGDGNETFSPCTVWKAGLGTRGYGQFSWKGKQYAAHRLSYTLNKGPIPEGHNVCHECDNRQCINPDHLYAGTQADNMLDKEMRRRGDQPYGEFHYRHELTNANIIEMRKLWKTGNYYQRELAERFSVSRDAVHKIVNYKTYRHLP